jgi:hypothetical protein
MNTALAIFNRLLADISIIEDVRLRAPEDLSYDWILIEGPKLDKVLLEELETGKLQPVDISEWIKPLWEKWFATRKPLTLKSLRQVLVFGYKAEHEPSEEQLQAAQAAFLSTEEGLETFNTYLGANCQSPFFREARRLVSRVISRGKFSVLTDVSHGPGAVFPPCKPSEKSDFRIIYPNIDKYYPFFEYFRATTSAVMNALQDQDTLEVGGDITAKLTAVPKDSRGPRLICVHPKESIWIQQGLRHALEKCITQNPLTRGKINFTDQTVNQVLAIQGSIDGSYATIDLKSASDTVSLELFRYLFGNDAQYFESCRAEKLRLLDGRLHTLRTYAPMGNATTFPVEALVFWAVVRAGILSLSGEICSDVYVFGDDIIVPTRYYHIAIRSLVRAGFIPNQGKCFYRGSFRESCGCDAFNGTEVTPIRLKRSDVRLLSDQVSLCAIAKAFRARGYEETAAYIYTRVRQQRRGKLGLTNNIRSAGIHEWVDRDFCYLLHNEPTIRWNWKLHIWETEIVVPISSSEQIENYDWHHVQDSIMFLLKGLNEPHSGYPLPHGDRYSCGWTEVDMSDKSRPHLLLNTPSLSAVKAK